MLNVFLIFDTQTQAMKNLLLSAFSILALSSGFAQTATNFTVNDCSSVSHDLFAELNAGKVVVMTWVMPCGACIGPAATASNTVAGFSNPNVVFYLVDDYGNTSCGTLGSWATTNGITYNARFSNASISMADYGAAGMPKTVVIGGWNHTVFYNVNGANNVSTLQTAINNAIVATGIVEPKITAVQLSAFPNPAVSTSTITYNLSSSSDVNINVLNILGEKVKSVSLGKQSDGSHQYKIDLTSLSKGIYFIQLNAGTTRQTVKLVVSD
jgi:hypothetical protein